MIIYVKNRIITRRTEYWRNGVQKRFTPPPLAIGGGSIFQKPLIAP